MLPIVRNLFVRVIERKILNENKGIEEILSSYPKLSQEDKIEIIKQFKI